MIGEVLLDTVLVKESRCGLSGEPVLVLVAFQTEGYEEEDIGVSLAHGANLCFFREFLVHLEQAGDDVAFGSIFGETVGLQDGDITCPYSNPDIRPQGRSASTWYPRVQGDGKCRTHRTW